MSHQDDLSPRERARAACPPGRPRALFTLDELRARRRNSHALDLLCGGPVPDRETAAWAGEPGMVAYVQPHDGYRPSQLPHNSDYGASPEGAPHTHGAGVGDSAHAIMRTGAAIPGHCGDPGCRRPECNR